MNHPQPKLVSPDIRTHSRPNGWALLCVIPLLVSGCRTPWLPASSADPSLDRVIEIERSKARRAGSRESQLDRQVSSTPYSDADDFDSDYRSSDRNLAATRRINMPDSYDSEAGIDLAALTEEGGPDRTELLMRTLQSGGRRPPQRRPGSDRPLESDRDDAPEESISFNLNDHDSAAPKSRDTQSETASSQQATERDAQPSRAGADDRYALSAKDKPPRVDSSTDRVRRFVDQEIQTASFEEQADRGQPAIPTDAPGNQSLDTNASPQTSTPMSELAWQDILREASQKLDSEISDEKNPELRVDLEKKRRMLSLVSGDLSGAMEPVPGVEPELQEYLQYNFQAMYDATDPNGHPHPGKRHTLALQSARKALRHLAAASDLEVKNAAFCRAVESYGDIDEFEKYTFRAGEEVLLYCEVDNFVSLAVPDGESYETHLSGSYQLVGTGGYPVEDQSLPANRHVSRTPRRDYFMVYRIWMPKTISPGEYQIKLAIEDLNGRKFGHSTVDFKITQ